MCRLIVHTSLIGKLIARSTLLALCIETLINPTPGTILNLALVHDHLNKLFMDFRSQNSLNLVFFDFVGLSPSEFHLRSLELNFIEKFRVGAVKFEKSVS